MRRFGFVQSGLHISLLFAVLPPPLNGQRIGARVTRRAAKPAGQNSFVAERSALRARMMKTACVISSARCGSRTDRSATE